MVDVPVCTWSPFCSSDIVIDFPFAIWTLAMDGKQLPPPEGGGVEGGGVDVVVTKTNIIGVIIVCSVVKLAFTLVLLGLNSHLNFNLVNYYI